MSMLACLFFIKTTKSSISMHEIGLNNSKTHKTIFAIFKKTKNSSPISRITTDLKIVLTNPTNPSRIRDYL